ncbi:HAD family hydrolase [Candidatus Woesearchaeota archaeon]|nr:HAD family hydrolase [Candidatus Woesearchaeota archaeon]
MKKKVLVFDLWGTIVETGVKPSPSRQIKYFLRVRESFSDFVLAFEHSFMTRKFESLKQGFEHVVKDFNLRIPDFVYEKMIGMWNKNVILSEMYEDVKPVLEELRKKKYKTVLLANIDQFAYEQLEHKHQLSELFDAVYPSFETGLLKINSESFEKIAKDLKVEKEEILMIGDSVHSDMEAAEKAGIQGLLLDRKDNREYDNKILLLTELEEQLKK